MAKRFSGYCDYKELTDHYIATISEVYRILSNKGIFVFKCQDIVHNHKLHCTHINVVKWAESAGFGLVDLFILGAKHRMPVGKMCTQQHARIYHSYFLVFMKKSNEKNKKN